MRYAVINKANNIVNMIEADDSFKVPEHRLVQHEQADMSWTYDGTSFSPPPRVVEEPTEPVISFEDRINGLEARLAALEMAR